MGRQNTKPPYYSSLIIEKKQYSTNIPKPVGDKMKEKSNSTWKVVFKFEDGKIKLYWEPLKS
ncbi:MAG: hypothetical protein HeimC2_14360 [Candidatus Heimdallarchaeota archaeon LC_2]|nr:MAG: hypothetical protein HeimC2_14360 [Candidatus Heimdallarchaeota archaeon LC_2]